MPIVAEAKTGKDFELPKEGTTQASLAEVRDLGLIDTVFNGTSKKVHKVLFRWQLAELDAEGEPKRLYQRFTLSLHTKSGLYKAVKQIFGKEPPTTLDLEKLVGTNVNMVIVHAESNGKTYANCAAYLKLAANTPKLEIVKIAPPKEKVPAGAGTDSRAVTDENPITSDDIPF